MPLPFAVVYFKNDDSYSEIPTSWIMEGNVQCKWPRTKNPITLMKKDSCPNIDWPIHDIEVHGYCETIDKARKKAEDSSYTSHDEDFTGRGQRSKKLYAQKKNTQADSSDDTDESDSPPKINLAFKGSGVKPQRENLIKVNNISTNPDAEPNKQSAVGSDHHINGFIHQSTGVQKGELFGYKGQSTVKSTSSPGLDRNSSAASSCKSAAPSSQEAAHTPTKLLVPTIIEDICIPAKGTLATTADIDKMMGVCVETLEYVKSLTQAVKKLQTRTNNFEETQNFFEEKLPIHNKLELDMFEEILTNKDQKSHFDEFIKSIGGRNHKELVHKPLKQIFTDAFAMKCSWLGQRNNYRICDLQCIKIIKGLLATQGVQQSSFETITSEWFRLAKLRFDRHEKKRVAVPENENLEN